MGSDLVIKDEHLKMDNIIRKVVIIKCLWSVAILVNPWILLFISVYEKVGTTYENT